MKAGHSDPSARGFSAAIYAAAAGTFCVNRKASLHSHYTLLETDQKEANKRTNHKTGDIQIRTRSMLNSPYAAEEG